MIDLRIGNIFKHGGTYVKVSAIFISHFNCTSLDGIIHGNSLQENFAPIPLTPEILIACGIKQKKDNQYYWEGIVEHNLFVVYTFHYHKSQSKLTVGIQTYNKDDKPNGLINISWEVIYLHQLQNLYYALTQTELIYKP